MRSIKTSSLVRSAFAMSLALAFTSVTVHAGDPGPAFSNGETLTAARMNTLNSAVADNNTRLNAVIANTQAGALKTEVDKIPGIINNTQTGTLKTQVDKISGLETDVNNLKQNIGTGSCGTGMTRVGPSCVDNTRGPNNTSWLDAVAACRTAGKRLLTPGEWVAAKLQGALTDAANDQLEWVDQVAFNTTAPFQMHVGYIGTRAALGGGIAFFDNQLSTATFGNVFYRCAR